MKNSLFKYLLALVIFGSNGITASAIDMGSVEIVLCRAVIGSVFLLAVFFITRQKITSLHAGKHFLYLVISGAAMGAGAIFLFEAYQQAGVSVATLAYYCGPIVVVVAASFVFKEALTVPKILGLITVVIGVVCVNGLEILNSGISWGLMCGLLGALMYAIMVIFNKKATKITGLENATIQIVVSALVIAVFFGFTHTEPLHIPSNSIVPVLFLGVMSGGLACYLYFSSLQKLSAQTVSICGYIEPLSALVFSAALLGEVLAPIQLVGAACILGGAALSELLGTAKARQVARSLALWPQSH